MLSFWGVILMLNERKIYRIYIIRKAFFSFICFISEQGRKDASRWRMLHLFSVSLASRMEPIDYRVNWWKNPRYHEGYCERKKKQLYYYHEQNTRFWENLILHLTCLRVLLIWCMKKHKWYPKIISHQNHIGKIFNVQKTA